MFDNNIRNYLNVRKQMSSNSFKDKVTDMYIYLSRPADFLLIFVITTLNSSWVNCPRLMSYWLFIIFVICLSVTFRDFPSKFLKCSFHIWIHSSWLADFSFSLEILFLLLTSLVWAILFVIAYLLLNFLFYWFDFECILFVSFVMLVFFVAS